MIKITLAAAALLAGSALPAFANECHDLHASHGADSIWTCHVSYEKGDSGTSLTQCFAAEDEGFEWVASHTGSAGQVHAANCNNQGNLKTYNAWVQSK